MEDMQVNNVYKIKDKVVDYYELWGQKYQFDEIFEVWVDINDEELGRDAAKVRAQYPSGRMPKITTIDKIYEGLEDGSLLHPELNEVKGFSPFIKKGDIKKTTGVFNPKILLFLADELNEFASTEDYKSLEVAKTAMGSIARLGRAAGCHLALAMQRASSGTVSADLMNNIQQSILLGAFDSGASQNMFEKDISHLAKPEIKGRAFMQIGKKTLYEVQTYYTQPDKDWVFDENRRDTFKNPEWQKQKFGEVINDDLVRLNALLKENGFLTDTENEERLKKVLADTEVEHEELVDEAMFYNEDDDFENEEAEQISEQVVEQTVELQKAVTEPQENIINENSESEQPMQASDIIQEAPYVDENDYEIIDENEYEE